MRYFLFILSFLLFTSIQAGTTATTENQPSALVNGVNVITGDLYLLENDLTVQGAEPIHLQRNYISQKGDGYWNMFSYHRAFIDFVNEVIEIIEPSGARLFYRWKTKYTKKGQERTFFAVNPNEENSKGLTNMAKGKPSGKTNLKNQTIHLGSDDSKLSVVCPDGTRRVYHREHFYEVDELMDWNISSLPSHRKSFLLVKEELPNLRQIRYQWPRDKKDVWEIKTCDREEKYIYSWVKFYPHNGKNPKTGKKDISHGDYGIETSDGRHMELSFFTHNKVHQLKSVTHDEKPDQTYQYFSYNKKKFLKSIVSEEGRFLNINYYTPGEHFGKQLHENDSVCFRVKELIAPVGDQGAPVTTHRFLYDLNNKKTTVLDPYDVPTDYYWNDDLRLAQINRFTKPGTLHSQERFIWGANDSKDASNLLCRMTLDANENPISAIKYEYDSYGNVEKETFYGNLSGAGSTFELSDQGLPIDGKTESYSKKSTYSNDGKNLLLSQEEGNGLSISYTYFKDTNLLEKEVYYVNGVPQKEKSYGYDPENGVLTQDSTRDLQGNLHVILQIFPKSGYKVSSKGDDYIYPKLPSRIEERHGPDHLVTETKLSYTKGGRVSQKQVYIDQPQRQELRLSKYTYSRGCLQSETDFFGNRSESTYDSLNNLKTFKDFGGRSSIRFEYDQVNRPYFSEETGEGLSRTLFCKYDHRGHKLEAYDPYGNKTSYEYDPFGHVIKTHNPTGGVISSQFDASGNLTSLTDAKGNITQTVYNAYNKPIQILYPNGSSEQFSYYLNGDLKSHIDQEGMQTDFTYDAFGRLLSKKTPFSEETLTYDSFNVLKETDAEGRITTYEYDAGGRKVLEKKGNEVIRYSYDRLGRVHHTVFGELSLITEHNPLDQVVQTRKLDPQGNLLEILSYAYDASCNLTSIQKQIHGKNVEEVQGYDAFKRLKYRKDPEGHTTHFDYDDLGHKQITTDALGSKTIKSFNADHKIALLEKISPQGISLLQEFYAYDLNQNLKEKQVIGKGITNTTRWDYDEMDLLITLKEGAGTPLEKITAYTYTPKGLLYQTIKPSGTILTNIYHPLNFLERQFSSDGTVDYTYIHDRTGLLKQSVDEVQGAHFSRSYTEQGRLETEILLSKFSFQNSYDLQGRRNLLELPDGSHICYDYNALHLQSVSKIHKGTTLYTHKYTSYDLSGNLLYEMPIANLAPTAHSYDSLGRHIEVASGYFSEKVSTFDPVGNLLGKRRNGIYSSYTYDDVYQLTSETDHTYSYDALHNRIAKDGTPSSINVLNQTSNLTYNSDGNPLSYEGKALTYDALDRLISVEDSSQKILYAYDSLHRRLSKKTYKKDEISGSLSLIGDLSYLYDDQNEIGTFDNFLDQIIELRVLGSTPHAEIGSAIALELYGKIYMPIHDLQGNIAALIFIQDGSLEQFSYSAFGEENNSSSNPWRFSSKRIDSETGFAYYGRRYYLPSLGRWLTLDPLGLEAGPNLYAFLSNAPLTRFDLYGLIEEISFATPPSFEYSANSISKAVAADRQYLDMQDSQYLIPHYTVGSQEIPNRFTIMVNGINTKLHEAMDYAKIVSDFAGGAIVHGVYNSAHLGNACLGLLGHQRACSDFLAAKCNEFLTRYEDSSIKALIVCHSDGATHVYNFLKNLKLDTQQRFLALPIAPATIISRDICFDSYNYTSKRDFISIMRPIAHQIRKGAWDFFLGGSKFENFDELHFLSPQTNAKFHDHNFNSPTFS